jgi:molybdopterin-guanine dinucleotide biosynthesis protein A
MRYDAVVLAGGGARRLGGVDKPALPLGDASLLDHVLVACAGAQRTIVVGPRRPVRGGPVVWCSEDPPGGGPVAAVSAGLRHAEAEFVLVLAGDMPFVAAAVPDLLAAAPGRDGALLCDRAGRDQPLAAVYRRAPLAARLAGFGSGHGVAMRRMVAGLDLARVPDSSGAAHDCDTWADVTLARQRADPTGGS